MPYITLGRVNFIYRRGPKVSLTRLVDSDGVDMLALGAHVVSTSPSRDESQFALPGPPELPSGALHQSTRSIGLEGVVLPYVPAGLRQIEGEVDLEVVTEESTREFFGQSLASAAEVLPGVHLQLRRGADSTLAELVLRIDSDGDAKALNFIAFFCGSDRGLAPWDYANLASGTEHRWTIPASCVDDRLLIRTHAVVATAHRVLRFSRSDLQFPPNAKDAAAAVDDPSRIVAAASAGYELCIAGVRASASSIERDQVSGPQIELACDVRSLDVPQRIGRMVSLSGLVLTDGDANSITPVGNARMYEVPQSCSHHRYIPLPVLPEPPATASPILHSFVTVIPVQMLPRVVGSIRGVLNIAEVTAEQIFEIELAPEGSFHEPAPGVTVKISAEVAGPDVARRLDAIEVCVNGHPTELDAPVPYVNLVQFADVAGVWADAECHANNAYRPGEQVLLLGKYAERNRAVKMRLHVVTAVEWKRVPFEFLHLPCALSTPDTPAHP